MNKTKEEIISFGKLIYDRGYNVSIDGNISVKISDSEICVTASGSRLGFLEESDLVLVDEDGNLIEGDKRPTSERILHTNIYKERPDVRAVIHAHAPNSVALSMLGLDLVNNLYSAMAPIPITEFAVPSTEESWLKLKPYVKDYQWAILQRHGVVCYEKDLLGAFLRLEGMEHYARTLISAMSVDNSVKPLDEADKYRLLKSWGLA
ncbi:MAG: class II aldolase/adducin family protein [Bacteroidales bacterium]|nr:class II aldolase/adducin family protein [Bacteroidales bacterium]